MQSVLSKMRFVKQSVSLPVQNFEEKLQSSSLIRYRRHSDILPDSIRSIVCGPSNCGKTNALLSLIESPNGLKFENIYIFSKTLNQNKYEYLEAILKPIKEINLYKFASTTEEGIVPQQEVKPHSIVIFDDIVCDKQDIIREYFCMGRHKHVDCFYLTQTFTRIPKHLIRDNVNFIVIFKQDDLNLRHIFNDYSIACDMKYEKFKKMCMKCWKNKYGFVVIDLDSEPNNGRYRKGFDCFIQINANNSSSNSNK